MQGPAVQVLNSPDGSEDGEVSEVSRSKRPFMPNKFSSLLCHMSQGAGSLSWTEHSGLAHYALNGKPVYLVGGGEVGRAFKQHKGRPGLGETGKTVTPTDE